MQTPKKFSSFSDQFSWISDEKGIKIKDREYAEEMLRQIGYFPLMGGYKHLFRISNTKKYKAGTSFEEIVSLYKFDAELREFWSNEFSVKMFMCCETYKSFDGISFTENFYRKWSAFHDPVVG